MTRQEIELRDQDWLDLAAAQVERGPQYVLPATGEIFDLRESGQVAAALDQVRKMENHLREAKRFLSTILRLRAREQGSKTLHLDGGWKAEISGGSRPTWDAVRLEELLLAAGCPPKRVQELIKTEISYKVDARVARQLAAANPDYAVALAECRKDVEAPWLVKITSERNVP